MKLFTTISIETGALCNRKCWFCPNALNDRPDEFMSDALIHDLLSQMGSIDYSGRIEFYIYNEPLRDNRIFDIISIARKIVPKSCIMIATNGDYAKVGTFGKLYAAGLNQLQVNVYSDDKRYETLKTILEEHTDAEEGNVYQKVSRGKRVYSLEKKYTSEVTPDTPKIGRFELQNRSGHVPSLGVPDKPLKKMCMRPFRYMQIDWEGQAILCCNDYYGEVVVGDAKISKLTDIWEQSKTLKKYRRKLLRKKRKKLFLCQKCSFNGGAYLHFLPKQWPELLKKG